MKRIAVVDNTKLKDMQLKEAIRNSCPINRTGTECIKIEEDGTLSIDELSCIGCGICVKKAPDAIKIINLPEQLEKDPLFRYGKNGFALYNIPIPIFGKVVGIIGRNGIGKSTAIKILSGILKPNFGKENEADEKEIIDFFKGTEAQTYFEKLFKGEVKVAYKPQQVELISKQFSGTVRELLEKVNKEKVDHIAENLDLSELLDRDIKNLSGGELQRVAIAATVLKDANVYIFDEPTSYLDIKQRLKITRFIRSLVNEEKAVLVVEHDLIVLDYITDNIHITYGKENVYGIVSMPKSSKLGINVYLDGYLKEENIRFRDKKISFYERPPFIEKDKDVLVSWSNIKKKLGDFTLYAESGELKKSDVCGIIGENGIGKTSFVKILADEIKADEGKVERNDMSVSYKPQYIEATDDFVSDLNIDSNLMKQLDLEKLRYSSLKELSGGQLQRVMIAKCLSKEADLYLLDEPSAYLDIEQRLMISKLIRDFAELTGRTILVVDHDLLFIDYISDKIITFTGKPAVEGLVKGPFEMKDGMNSFLKVLGITFRRDEETHRPRANKPESQMDRKQKNEGKYYY